MSRGTINFTISFRPAILSPIRSEASSKRLPAPSLSYLPLDPLFSSCHLRPGRDDSCAIMTSYFAGRGTLNSLSLSLLSFFTFISLSVSGIEDSEQRRETRPRVHGRRREFARGYFHTIISPRGARTSSAANFISEGLAGTAPSCVLRSE